MKTENEKFAGAFYTTALEALMPDGKALQLGTSHNLGQNFSKVFDIKFIGEDEEEHYVWQTSWGVSTRLIGAMVMVHGDDRGLVLPPREALYQVVIVPIPYKHVEGDVILEKARRVLGELQKKGISVILDDREEYTPGWKFNHWELKGVPIRIEIGPRDVKKKQVIAARRDTLEKVAVADKELTSTIEEMLTAIQDNLFNRAKKFLEDNITTVKTYDGFKEVLAEKGGFIKACWCSESRCEEKIKEETGATIRLIPFETEKVFANCIFCGKKADQVAFFARAY
jgi:prolyl-tRNA synthetase